MTEKQIEKMKKYAKLIRKASYRDGNYCGRTDTYLSNKYLVITDYLILRMEREMKQ